LLRDKRKS